MAGFNFDVKKLQREIEKKAEAAILKAAERAKRSLGSDGHGVSIHRLSSARRQGTKLTFGDASFPNEDVKRRFEEALRRELK